MKTKKNILSLNSCSSYAYLFRCADRKGMITHNPTLPPFYSSLPYQGHWVKLTRWIIKFNQNIPLSTYILTPNKFCLLNPYTNPTIPEPRGSINGYGSLMALRKSGCAPRPKGSSSRFIGEAPRGEIKDFGTQVTDFLKGPKGIITIVALVVLFVLTKNKFI